MEGKNNLFNNIMNGIRNNVENSNLGLYYNTSLLPELQDYNRSDTVNMSDEEMNKFRHIAGTKQALNDLGTVRGTLFSIGKEIDDFRRDGWKDTKYDLLNDARALKLHLKQPDLDGYQLYDHVFTNYIQPFRK
jgi:hypothetical protein